MKPAENHEKYHSEYVILNLQNNTECLNLKQMF